MLRLNPDTSDLVDRLSVAAPDGVRLVVMGGRASGRAAGCLCPETALVGAAVAGMRLHHRRRGGHGHPRRRGALRPGPGPGVRHRRGRRRARPTTPSRSGWSPPVWPAIWGSSSVHLVVNRARLGRRRRAGHGLRRPRWAASSSTSVNVLPYDGTVTDGTLGRCASWRARSVRRRSTAWPTLSPPAAPSSRGARPGWPDARGRHRYRAGRDHRRRDAAPARPVGLGGGPLDGAATRPYSPAGHWPTTSSPGATDPLYWKGRDVAERLGIDERREAWWSGSTPTTTRSSWPTGAHRLRGAGAGLGQPPPRAPRGGRPARGPRLQVPAHRRPSSSGGSAAVRRRSALIVGNGFIGVELSLLLADLGVDVTVVGRRHLGHAPGPRPGDLGPVAEQALAGRGVTPAPGRRGRGLRRGARRSSGVRLADGDA